MSVFFYSANPKALLAAFEARIAQVEPKGKITTWVKTSEHFTHKATDWAKKAFFLPKIEDDKLVFNIIRPKDENISVTTYGYYHGHLTETFLNHFDSSFTAARSSATPSAGDNVTA